MIERPQSDLKQLISTMGTAVMVRPIEVLVHAYNIVVGTGTPAAMRGSLATVVALAISWLASSTWSDTLTGVDHLTPWLGPAIELSMWTWLLRSLLRSLGAPGRFWRAWMAVAGISIFVSTFDVLLLLGGVPPLLAVIHGFYIGIRGYGRVLALTFNDILKEPIRETSLLAAAIILIIGIFSAVTNHGLMRILASTGNYLASPSYLER